MCSSTSAFSASSSAASPISPNPTCGSTGVDALGSVVNSRVQSKSGERQNRRRHRRSSERSCTRSAKLKSGLRIASMGEFRPGARSSHCSRTFISKRVVLARMGIKRRSLLFYEDADKWPWKGRWLRDYKDFPTVCPFEED